MVNYNVSTCISIGLQNQCRITDSGCVDFFLSRHDKFVQRMFGKKGQY